MRALVLALLAVVVAAPSTGQSVLHALVSPRPDPGGRFGHSVAGVPDVDGDGQADVVVGAPLETSLVTTNLGRAYVFSGATGVRLYTLISPDPQDEGQFGVSVAGLADLDGDGRGEIAVGASQEMAGGVDYAGRVHVYSGASGALLYTRSSPAPTLSGDFGGAIASVPDADGDGFDDLIAGAPNEAAAGLQRAGRAYLFSGASGGLVRTLQSPSPLASGAFGSDVAGAPDLDGDARGELLVGAESERLAAGGAQTGRAYVFSGDSGGLLHTLLPTGSTNSGFFGDDVAAAPDLDGDGRAELLVGAFFEQTTAGRHGRAYVYSGTSGSLLRVHEIPNVSQSGFAAFGGAVDGLPDLNGDGRGEYAIGAYNQNDSGRTNAGRVYFYDGATGAVVGSIADPSGIGFGRFGYAVAAVDDADGDGRADLVVGAYSQSTTAISEGGGAYILSTATVVADESAPGTDVLALAVGPTPTSGAATLRFALPDAGDARLTLHDALGRTVATLVDGALGAGPHAVAVDAGRLAPGVYVARLAAAVGAATALVVVVR